MFSAEDNLYVRHNQFCVIPTCNSHISLYGPIDHSMYDMILMSETTISILGLYNGNGDSILELLQDIFHYEIMRGVVIHVIQSKKIWLSGMEIILHNLCFQKLVSGKLHILYWGGSPEPGSKPVCWSWGT